MKRRLGPLLIGLLLMALLDAVAVVTMTKRPDLSTQAILAMLFVQLFGVIGIATTYFILHGTQKENMARPEQSSSSQSDPKRWAFFLIAISLFLRAFVSGGEVIEGHADTGTTVLALVELSASIVCFYLAWTSRRRPSRT